MYISVKTDKGTIAINTKQIRFAILSEDNIMPGAQLKIYLLPTGDVVQNPIILNFASFDEGKLRYRSIVNVID